jgi:hypothetical protein
VGGAQACRTLLAALEAQLGKPIPFLGAPAPSPLTTLSPEQTLDLVIAKLRAVAESRDAAPTQPAAAPSGAPGLRLAYVPTPPRTAIPSSRRGTAPRKKP